MASNIKKTWGYKKCKFWSIKICYIDDHDVAQFYRQNIIITKHQTPKIKQLFQQSCLNIFGRIKIQRKHNSILEKIITFIRQELYRFVRTENNDNNDDINQLRLDIYKKYMLPIFRNNKGIKTLIFVSSYYDFLRLRRLYKNVNNIKFLSEYTTESDENKFRRQFLDETNENIMYLVIAERYYFYQRIKCLRCKCWNNNNNNDDIKALRDIIATSTPTTSTASTTDNDNNFKCIMVGS